MRSTRPPARRPTRSAVKPTITRATAASGITSRRLSFCRMLSLESIVTSSAVADGRPEPALRHRAVSRAVASEPTGRSSAGIAPNALLRAAPRSAGDRQPQHRQADQAQRCAGDAQ